MSAYEPQHAVTPRRKDPTSLRWPKDSDLPAWYVRHAAQIGVSVNAALIFALEYYRDAIEGSVAPPPLAAVEPPKEQSA
jgi:hypothetical protein